ncbi:hypothetical protein GCM10007887_37550 [Methylobacterium haplocladii]|uniref:Uncharacterized protein n=1 Tax=Methylobacterium haplocladii TaxID=1176176 RepID=A0A512IW56_9HYPH|nr:hypothetical protein MHA02_42260 [Methylobacterium haplocladii]GLS61061.1 hypothetical protein GCM10007887_37550 [Methylobacterium haplocladii]
MLRSKTSPSAVGDALGEGQPQYQPAHGEVAGTPYTPRVRQLFERTFEQVLEAVARTGAGGELPSGWEKPEHVRST